MSNKKKVLFLVLGIVFVFLTMELPATYPYPSWDYGNYSLYNTTHMALYNFNEGVGSSTRDDSGRGKTGIFSNPVLWVQEKDLNLTQNAAVYFNGSGQYATVAHNTDFNISSAEVKGFVFSAMIKADICTKPYMMICSKYEYIAGPPVTATGFTFYLTNGNLRFTAYNGSSQANIQDSSGADLRDGLWHFVAVEYFNGTYRLFIDPKETFNGQVCAVNSTVQPANNKKDFFIAHREHPYGWDDDKDFQGTIDCLYFYEIEPETVFNPPHRMWGFNNEGYWGFDEGSGTPYNIINDLARWTSNTAGYHSYGKFYGTGFNFLARTSAWKGEHAAEFNNVSLMNTYIQVPDPTNRLDFAANPNYEDLYIEFLFMLNNTVSSQSPLVEKYDPSPANGYRVYYVGSYSTGTLYFEVARNGLTGRVQTPVLSFGAGWKHVWAWAQNGVLHLIVKNESSGATWQFTQGITCGIGASSNPLYFAIRPSSQYYYDGWLDEVVIGRLYPGLEY
ncbi:MAG TPA: LamG-like jellyroll fold domain-containing protein [Candidatus Kapabacteria bacterium]|nr:LamG-like jellyroll fold domain-containing protein [Candidatus Kapabacteria bacterium]